METDIEKLKDLLLKAYKSLAESPDRYYDGDRWHSSEQLALMESIADALDIEEKDRL